MLLLIQNCRFCGLVKWAPKSPNVKGLVPSCGHCWQAVKPQEVELSVVEVGHRDITLKWKNRTPIFLFSAAWLSWSEQFPSPHDRGLTGYINHQWLLSLVYDNFSLHSLISVLTAHPHVILIPSCGLYLSWLQGYPQSSSVLIASLTQKLQSLHCGLSLY